MPKQSPRFRQIAVHCPDDDALAKIDRAAKAAGESRSAYILRAALERADIEAGELTAAQRRAIEAIGSDLRILEASVAKAMKALGV